MNKLLDRYNSAYPNLKLNDLDYPIPDYLKSIAKIGNIDFESEMDHDTDESNLFKNILLNDKPGPTALGRYKYGSAR